jgi:error-prone DNA polymerase
MTAGREVVEDYRSTGLSLRAHPLAFLRESLRARGYAPCQSIRSARNGSQISIAGLLLVRQMPGSAKGVMFITLEDKVLTQISSSGLRCSSATGALYSRLQ